MPIKSIDPQPVSPVIALLDLVSKNANAAMGRSYERINSALRDSVRMAIGAGFKFEDGDLAHITSNYGSSYWIGACTEWMYSEAVSAENVSAIAAYEAWKGRGSFIADDVKIYQSSKYVRANGQVRQCSRVCVGARFRWKGCEVKVTSFSADGRFLTACSYKKAGNYTEKIDKRFRISREDIIADRAERKERWVVFDKLSAIGAANGNNKKILAALGAKNKEEFAGLPLEKIRKVLKQFSKEAAKA